MKKTRCSVCIMILLSCLLLLMFVLLTFFKSTNFSVQTQNTESIQQSKIISSTTTIASTSDIIKSNIDAVSETIVSEDISCLEPVTVEPTPSHEPVTMASTSSQIPESLPCPQPSILSKAEIEANFKSLCQECSYEEIIRDPNGKMGEYFQLTGEVFEVGENNSYYHISEKNEPFNRFELWYIGEALKSRIINGDTITVWGVSEGLIDCKTVFGSNVAIPALSVMYIYNHTSSDGENVSDATIYSSENNEKKNKVDKSDLKSNEIYDLSPYLIGQISSDGSTIEGYTTDYVCHGAERSVQWICEDTWHITARRKMSTYGVVWYECWDTDDGDYYGWIDGNFLCFNP